MTSEGLRRIVMAFDGPSSTLNDRKAGKKIVKERLIPYFDRRGFRRENGIQSVSPRSINTSSRLSDTIFFFFFVNAKTIRIVTLNDRRSICSCWKSHNNTIISIKHAECNFSIKNWLLSYTDYACFLRSASELRSVDSFSECEQHQTRRYPYRRIREVYGGNTIKTIRIHPRWRTKRSTIFGYRCVGTGKFDREQFSDFRNLCAWYRFLVSEFQPRWQIERIHGSLYTTIRRTHKPVPRYTKSV